MLIGDENNTDNFGNNIRPIDTLELASMIGLDINNKLCMTQMDPMEAVKETATIPSKEMIIMVMEAIILAEHICLPTIDNSATVLAAMASDATLPLPTTAQWKPACDKDKDIAYIIRCITQKLKVDKVNLKNNKIFSKWKANRLEIDKGALFCYEDG